MKDAKTAQDESERRPRVLLGISGSVAAVKGPEIAVRLSRDRIDVRVLLTHAGKGFWQKSREYSPQYWDELMTRLKPSSNRRLHANEGEIVVHSAEDEWKGWERMGDSVLHIDLRNWADIAVVAPLSAHTLSKFANGLCDDTLSCVIRAWDFGHGSRPGKPLVLAPAMNTAMWEHPITEGQLKIVQSFWNVTREPMNGIHIVRPHVKTLACTEVGQGALAPVDEVVRVIADCVSNIRQEEFVS